MECFSVKFQVEGYFYAIFVDSNSRTFKKRTHSATLLKVIACVFLMILKSFAIEKLLRINLSVYF